MPTDSTSKLDTRMKDLDRRIAQRMSGINQRLADRGLRPQNLDTSTGLYRTAVDSGLKREADNILRQNAGEETKKIFSGGFISDAFDVLNAMQYGVVGMMKGKTFMEGVKTRQSWTDQDALGDLGLPGVIGGTILDIAFDPLTYIAPLTVIKHIPGAVKAGKAISKAAVGERVAKLGKADKALKLTRLKETREGGTKVGKLLAEKVVYGFGVDPVYRHLGERMHKSIGEANMTAVNIARKLSKFDTETAQKLIRRTADGTVKRVPLAELKKTLSPEEFEIVQEGWKALDDYGRQAVKLGLLSKRKFEEDFGRYLKNSFKVYEKEKRKGSFFGKAKAKVTGFKDKKTAEEFAGGYLKSLDATEAKKLYPKAFDGNKLSLKGLSTDEINKIASKAKEELGQIDRADFLLLDSTLRLIHDVENAKFFNRVSRQFGSDSAEAGMAKIGDKVRRFDTVAGARKEILKDIRGVNKEMKPILRKLRSAFESDKKKLSEIKNLEKEMSVLSKKIPDELTKYFQEGEVVSKVTGKSRILKGAAKLPENLQEIGRKIETKGLTDELKLKVEKLYEQGVLEEADFKDILTKKGEIKTTGMEQFLKFITEPYKGFGGKVKEEVIQGNLNKVRQLRKRLAKLTGKATTLSKIDKKSINDAMINWEKQLSDLKFGKEELVGKLEDLKLGQLAGKYVPEDIHKLLTEIQQPDPQNFGKKAMAGFKYSKVILNPGTHARNIMSNMILNWWKLGIGPWRLDLYKEAFKQAKHGGNYVSELRKAKVGYGVDTFATQELGHILDAGKEFGKGTKAIVNRVKNKLGDYYQFEENTAKLAAYIAHRKKGIGIEEAWKAAESATFNYAQVTPMVRKLRTSMFGMPFITFGVKAAPVAVETALKHPGRISLIGKMKTAIENQADIEETDKERASEAPWIKDGFYIKLPFKDKEGRSMYFDMTYIIPFGDLVSGQFVERNISRETGLREDPVSAALSKSPLLNTLKELSKNQDFTGRRIFRESDSTGQVGQDIFRHLTKTYLPPPIADQIPTGYNDKGERRGITETGVLGAATQEQADTQKRTITQELLKHMGVKLQPMDIGIQESMKEWNTKKGLRTLLQDQGVVSNFSTSYIPK